MFDTENLRPAVIAMVLFVIIVHLTPKIITRPTQIKFIDDLVLYIMSNKDTMTSGAILTGIIIYASNYINVSVL
jgi:hypothetical protein